MQGARASSFAAARRGATRSTDAALRDRDPLHHVEAGDFYVLTRFADVWAAAGDPKTFSSASGLTVNYGEIDAIGMGDATPMVFLDPPEHTRFRNLLTGKLTPRKVSTIEPDVRSFVVERIDRLRELGNADIVAELFKPLPSYVVAHYLGVPAEDRVCSTVGPKRSYKRRRTVRNGRRQRVRRAPCLLRQPRRIPPHAPRRTTSCRT